MKTVTTLLRLVQMLAATGVGAQLARIAATGEVTIAGMVVIGISAAVIGLLLFLAYRLEASSLEK